MEQNNNILVNPNNEMIDSLKTIINETLRIPKDAQKQANKLSNYRNTTKFLLTLPVILGFLYLNYQIYLFSGKNAVANAAIGLGMIGAIKYGVKKYKPIIEKYQTIIDEKIKKQVTKLFDLLNKKELENLNNQNVDIKMNTNRDHTKGILIIEDTQKYDINTDVEDANMNRHSYICLDTRTGTIDLRSRDNDSFKINFIKKNIGFNDIDVFYKKLVSLPRDEQDIYYVMLCSVLLDHIPENERNSDRFQPIVKYLENIINIHQNEVTQLQGIIQEILINAQEDNISNNIQNNIEINENQVNNNNIENNNINNDIENNLDNNNIEVKVNNQTINNTELNENLFNNQEETTYLNINNNESNININSGKTKHIKK